MSRPIRDQAGRFIRRAPLASMSPPDFCVRWDPRQGSFINSAEAKELATLVCGFLFVAALAVLSGTPR